MKDGVINKKTAIKAVEEGVLPAGRYGKTLI
jgi:hypothetical protein